MKHFRFPLILLGTVGQGFSQWFLLWSISRTHGASVLGEYSLVVAGATPIFIFVGLGLRNIYITLDNAPDWGVFFKWRLVGLSLGVLLLAAYCALLSVGWEIFAGMAAIKLTDGLIDISLAKLQKQDKLNTMSGIHATNAGLSILVILVCTAEGAPIYATLLGTASVSGILIIPAVLLSHSRRIPQSKSPATFPRVLRSAIPVTASVGGMTLISSLPIWFIEANTSLTEVGRYTAIAYLVGMANIVGAAIQTFLLSSYRIARDKNGVGRLIQLSDKHLALLGVCALPILALTVLFGDPVLKLVYGRHFGASYIELFFFGLAAALSILGYVSSTVLLVLNRYTAQLVGVGLAVMCVLLTLSIGNSTQLSGGWVGLGMLALMLGYLVRALLSRATYVSYNLLQAQEVKSNGHR